MWWKIGLGLLAVAAGLAIFDCLIYLNNGWTSLKIALEVEAGVTAMVLFCGGLSWILIECGVGM